jgi:Zn-finger nucleic acid-binding protein
MMKIEIKREPTPKGQLMSDRESTKILAMINSKVKRGVEVTCKDIEEQVFPGVPHVGSYMLPIITMLFLTSSDNASSASTSILNLSVFILSLLFLKPKKINCKTQLKRRNKMLKIEINREPTAKGQLMNDRELTKILVMINSKVKRGVEITYKDIEEQVLRTHLRVMLLALLQVF